MENLQTRVKETLTRVMTEIKNPDYETKKIVMALHSYKTKISKRKEKEVLEILDEADALLNKGE